MLQWLHLVSFLGVKDMGITDIKRVLRLYFIQQLAKDELVRSGNMLNPFDKWFRIYLWTFSNT
jgi:hypothetical protein